MDYCVIFFSIFALCMVAGAQDHSKICLDAESLSPCTCTKACANCKALTVCSNLLSMQQLNSVFEKSKGSVIWDLTIQNSSFLYIPSNVVAELQVRKLRLRHNAMTSLFDKSPSSSNKLELLEISNLKVRRGVQWKVFSSLTHLDELNITSLEVKKIDQSFTDHFPRSLTSLYFSDTNTKTLGKNAFSKLTELVMLYVRNTRIKTLSRSMFPTPSKLMLLEFSGNRISTLPDNLFTNMPELVGIELSRTNIVEIKQSVFGEIINQLDILSLEENKIICDCKMKWITKLDKKPMYLDGVCGKPNKLKGQHIKTLTSTFFKQCA